MYTITNFALLISVAYFLVAICYLYFAVSAFRDDPKSKNRRAYFRVMLLMMFSCLFYGAMTISETMEYTRVFWAIGLTTYFLFLSFWIRFVSNMVNIKSAFLWHAIREGFVISSVIISVLCVLSEDVTFVSTIAGKQFSYYQSFLFEIVSGYALILVVSIYIMHIKWWRESKLKRHRRQQLVFLLLTVIVAGPGYITDMLLPVITANTMTPIVQFLLLPSFTILYFSMIKHRTLSIGIPNVASFIFKSVSVPTIILDHEDKISIFNDAASELLFNITPGKNIIDFIYIKDKKQDNTYFQDNIAGEIVTVWTASGKRTCEMMLKIQHDDFNETLCKVVVLNDITDILNQRDILQEERIRAELAEERNTAKSDFLAKMSHEIRTPMNAILGMVELALRSDDKEDIREKNIMIKQAGDNLLSIINSILDISKIESGHHDLILDEYYTKSLINDVVNLIKVKVLGLRLRFLVDVDPSIPSVLFGDIAKIRQVIINLLGNAIKFTEKGFILLYLGYERKSDNKIDLIIRVEDSGRGIKEENLENLYSEFIQFEIEKNKDLEGTGLGLAISNSFVKAMDGTIYVKSEYGTGSIFTVTIPQEVVNNEKLIIIKNPDDEQVLIFERREICKNLITRSMVELGINFNLVSTIEDFQNELQINNKYSYIFISVSLYERVKEIYKEIKSSAKVILVAEHGETVIEKNISVLTTPIFSVPVANIINCEQDRYTLTNEDKSEDVVSFTAPDARVLIVDDIKTNLMVARGIMLPYKMQVDSCVSGPDAIEAVGKSDYDLIFIDHMMPKMDGIETLKHIRALLKDGNRQKIPAIAFTANVIKGVREMLLTNGFDDFISKPIDTNRLNALLVKWLPENKQLPLE